MPSASAPNPRAGSAAPDDLDNLFNYDKDVDDFLRNLPLDKDSNDTPEQPAKDVDEEINVKKKRAPVPKLDEGRLLSDAGVPRLRKIAKKKLRFQGKGHEFSDISRLLNTYQLWLDDLYPRAKFRDALSMVEKLGHTKRMQITRRAWIDATKPNRREESPERLGDVEMSGALDGLPDGETRPEGSGNDDLFGDDDLFGENVAGQRDGGATRQDVQHDDVPEEDELDALMAEDTPTAPGADSQPQQQQKRRAPFEEDDDDEPDGDELNALMAENATTAPKATTSLLQPKRGPFEEEDDGPDEDELDALMAEESMDDSSEKATGIDTTNIKGHQQVQRQDDDFADEEEAMASMGGAW